MHLNRQEILLLKVRYNQQRYPYQNNIAEGFDSRSKREFMRFLGIARNSGNEVKPMCYLAERLKHIEVSKKNDLLFLCEEVTRIIVGVTKSIQNKIEVK